MAMAKRPAVKSPSAPLERQHEEKSEAFAAFKIYRDATPKISAAKVGEKCGKSASLMERWCTQYHWKDRREAWEDEQDRITRETLNKGMAAMLKKHVDLAGALQFKALQALQHIKAEEMSASDIVRILELSVKVERTSRGDAIVQTSLTEGNGSNFEEALRTAVDDVWSEYEKDKQEDDDEK
jgi:hypothetical protein